MNQEPSTCSRRDVLKLAVTAPASYAIPGLADAQSGAVQSDDARLGKMLGDFAEEILLLLPNQVTSLGLDTGVRAAAKSKLPHQSPAGDARWAQQVTSMIGRLDKLDSAALGPDAKIRYDSVRHAVTAGVAGERFSFGGAASGFMGGTAPYPVTQQDGAILWAPEFLHSQHKIENAGDAEAYLERVSGLARLLDQETARIQEQAGNGIAPSDAIARTALLQLQGYRMTPVAMQKLVTSIAGRAKAQAIAGDWSARATRNDKSVPSLESPLRADVVGAYTQVVQARHPGMPVFPEMSTGASDARPFRVICIPIYGVDGGWGIVPDDMRAHGRDERIPVKALDDDVDHWEAMLQKLAG